MVDLAHISKKELGKLFDHSVLPKNACEREIREGCRIARAYNCAAFYSATSYWTPVVREELAGSDLLIGTGIDFPVGASPLPVKIAQMEEALRAGCTTLDLIINVGAVRDGRYDVTKAELDAFKRTAGKDALTKVILEVCFLTDEEITRVCGLIAEAGLDYAKTSTGQYEGPSMDQFLVMKRALAGTGVKLKVAGVKFPRPQNAYAFIKAGAELIGTRASGQIIEAYDQMREIGLL